MPELMKDPAGSSDYFTNAATLRAKPLVCNGKWTPELRRWIRDLNPHQ
jgi:hypothetical protein